ncbi:cyclin-dependent kinase-like 4, partial [Colletotrichum asianum]
QHQTHCSSGPDFLPTRLVDLQRRQGNDDVVCVVHTVSANISDRRYMTLSHRWDHLTDEEAQLTVRNVDSRVEGLSLSSLPPSFRYAAFLTRELGIRYLWIDSLCILQDSREDWVR